MGDAGVAAMKPEISNFPATATEDPIAEIAAVLARGYLRSLARKAVPVAAKEPPEPETGLDDVGEKSVHGGRLTDGERP